jgi:hypothetical protein
MRVQVLALVSGVALALTCSAASAQQQFNGTWTVEVIPRSGTCDRTYRIPVIIRNGRVSYGGADGIGVSGAVTSRGAVRGSIGAGMVQASVAGRLTRRSGSGTWAASGSLNCSGQWRAAKLG